MLQLRVERTSDQCVANSKYFFWFPMCLLHISKEKICKRLENRKESLAENSMITVVLNLVSVINEQDRKLLIQRKAGLFLDFSKML